MQKLRKITAFLLLIVIAFSLSSCEKYRELGVDGPNCGPDPWEFYPDGYTAGFPSMIREWKNGCSDEIWWVETYEECLGAIELLKSRGSEFTHISLLSYEGEFCDIKYCFLFPSVCDGSEQISFGENPFDRKANNVIVYSCIFLDDVTVDEINYGDIADYNVYSAHSVKMKQQNAVYSFYYEWIMNDDNENTCLVYLNDEVCYRFIQKSKNQISNVSLSDECVWALISSIRTINIKGEIKHL